MRPLKLALLLFCATFSFFGMAKSSQAATIPAVSCSQTDVSTALAAAHSGDTVNVPAGTCTWSPLSVPDGVTLKGAGKDADGTIINTASYTTFTFGSNSRVTGFWLTDGVFIPRSSSQNWVVDNSRFVSLAGQKPVLNGSGGSQPLTGVYHNVDFYRQSFSIMGTNTQQDWYNNLSSVTGLEASATYGRIFFEGGSFTYDNCTGCTTMDGNYGMSRVVRFQTITGTSLATHGGRSNSKIRGTRLSDIYRNTINAQGAGYIFWQRGGEGIWFDNKCTGPANGCRNFIDFDRSLYPTYGLCAADSGIETVPHPLGGAGGNNYMCRDAAGAGRDLGLNTTPAYWKDSGNGSIYALNAKVAYTTREAGNPGHAVMQVWQSLQNNNQNHAPIEGEWWTLTADSPWQYGQESSPMYIWGQQYRANSGVPFTTSATTMLNHSSEWLREDRDIFIDSSSVPGSAYGGFTGGGVSTGLWEARPACNAGNKNYGYWATDKGDNWNKSTEYGIDDPWNGEDGALYTCDGAGTWTLKFTPPPYPHPLVQAFLAAEGFGNTDTTPPAVPTGLSVN